MRVKPFIHKASNWGGYYRLVFINEAGEIYEVNDCITYIVTSDAVEYVLDDTLGRYTQDRLIAVIEVERG